MGKYFVHARRKIKPNQAHAPADAAEIQAREREIADQRERERLQSQRARAEKEARALVRAAKKSGSALDHDTSGRQRTATRVAGVVLVSATAGMRTRSVFLRRNPGSAPCDLWGVDVKFEIHPAFNHCINDVAAPADIDAIHALRALAPRVAEQLFMGAVFGDGADENNAHTAHRLAESYMRKSYNASSLTGDERCVLSHAIFIEFKKLAALRLWRLRNEAGRIVDALMHKTEMSRSECNVVLAPVYEGFEQPCRNQPKP